LNILDDRRLGGLLSCSNMIDETTSSPDSSPDPSIENAPRVRRISTPRPKKVAKTAPPAQAATPVVAEIPSIPFPSARKREEPAEVPVQAVSDWPESEDASNSDAPTQTESAKRKRRRRKGKGQSNSQQNAGEPAGEEVHAPVSPESKPPESVQDHRSRSQAQPHSQQRPKIDPELLTKMAWKIYLAEVSEEGVALIGDNDAKDLSRRCFRLAEIFVEEQLRRR
jgi:hypothetical protein